jgi:hypothetical protein
MPILSCQIVGAFFDVWAGYSGLVWRATLGRGCFRGGPARSQVLPRSIAKPRHGFFPGLAPCPQAAKPAVTPTTSPPPRSPVTTALGRGSALATQPLLEGCMRPCMQLTDGGCPTHSRPGHAHHTRRAWLLHLLNLARTGRARNTKDSAAAGETGRWSWSGGDGRARAENPPSRRH